MRVFHPWTETFELPSGWELLQASPLELHEYSQISAKQAFSSKLLSISHRCSGSGMEFPLNSHQLGLIDSMADSSSESQRPTYSEGTCHALLILQPLPESAGILKAPTSQDIPSGGISSTHLPTSSNHATTE
jgi:hypothetical protein